MRVAVISDTHVSPKHGWFVDNVARTIQAVNAAAPDLAIHCGDVTVNGAEDEADLRFGAWLHARLTPPAQFIPGNHDIGEEPSALHRGQPIDPARIARYEAHFGPDHWARDVGEWRLVAFNCFLLGSDLPEEETQRAWLRRELEAARGRPIGVFTHKPLALDAPGAEEHPDWIVSPEHRDAYAALFAGARFILTGHLHQSRDRLIAGARHIWAPSCAFPGPPDMGGDRALGFMMLDLRDDGSFEARAMPVDGLVAHDYIALKAGYEFLDELPATPPALNWPG